MSQHTERMKRVPPAHVQEVAKALSGDLRLRILETLGDRTMSVTQLMGALGVAQPTVSVNVQILEQAGLVTTTQGAGREKLCARAHDVLVLELPKAIGESLDELEEIEMPVGLYTSCKVSPTCGLAGIEGIIGCPDDPRSFYLPERSEAELLWFSDAGYVEYRFPNPVPPELRLKALRISAELCSEALGFHEEWPSDVTLFVNGFRIGIVTPEGDFGEEKGKLTPNWWVYGTQYGMLYEWRIESDGSYIGERKVSEVGLESLGLHYEQPIDVRFEVERGAAHCRGLNLFGARFGNHPQGIKLTFVKS